MKKLILFALLVFFLEGVLAWGITPGKTTIDFTPGLEQTVSFSVVNTEQKDLKLAVSAQGELEDRIFISEKRISLSSQEESKQISYNIRLPQELTPGLHVGEVVVMELPAHESRGETFIGATVAAVSQLYVNVPYPGKYAEANVNIVQDADGKITFFFPVKSVGEFDLAEVRVDADIFTDLNKKIETLSSEETISIPSGERRELVLRWDASDVLPGRYLIKAAILYDGETTTVEREFNVGEKRLNLVSIEVNDFTLGEIAKFEVLVENKWSQAVINAYTEMVVYKDDGNVLGRFKSPTYDIPALEKILMISYWDTAGVRKGTYDTTFFLTHEGGTDERDLELEVLDDKINILMAGFVISKGLTGGGESSLVKILIGVIVFLVLVNLSWFIFLRKRFLKKQAR